MTFFRNSATFIYYFVRSVLLFCFVVVGVVVVVVVIVVVVVLQICVIVEMCYLNSYSVPWEDCFP